MKPSAETRARLARHWAERAVCEIRVAGVFSGVLGELLATGADPVVLELAAKAPADELRHAAICNRMAAHYAGEDVPWPAPGPTVLPAHRGVAPELVPALHVASHCCINETIACAWVEACHAMAKEPIARRALHDLLADEIDHGRLGWAHLNSRFVTPQMRAALGKWLPTLVKANLAAWQRNDPTPPARGVPDHGIPSQAFNRRVARAALRDLVLPGFDRVGVDTTDARAWLRSAG